MGYDDRVNREFADTIREDMKIERDADLKAAGPLLNDKQSKQLEDFLVQKCWLNPQAAHDVIETINALAGEKGANAKQVLKDALEGHVKPAFLKNDNNFTEAVTLLNTAISDRETRIASLHETGGPAVASTATSKVTLKPS